MKSYSELATEGDEARQDACGWGRGAWVGIKFPEPRTEAETKALAIVQERFSHNISVHVYNLVDFVTELIQQEMEDHSNE
jgi:hypothetical protein